MSRKYRENFAMLADTEETMDVQEIVILAVAEKIMGVQEVELVQGAS